MLQTKFFLEANEIKRKLRIETEPNLISNFDSVLPKKERNLYHLFCLPPSSLLFLVLCLVSVLFIFAIILSEVHLNTQFPQLRIQKKGKFFFAFKIGFDISKETFNT
jgi:hypothetical protein